MSSEPHSHDWQPYRSIPKAKICSTCSTVIVPTSRLGEQAIDCIHDWSSLPDGQLVCLNCSYVARGKSYRRWWKAYGKYNWRERPYCLNCREPTMDYGTMCARCVKVVKPVVV